MKFGLSQSLHKILRNNLNNHSKMKFLIGVYYGYLFSLKYKNRKVSSPRLCHLGQTLIV